MRSWRSEEADDAFREVGRMRPLLQGGRRGRTDPAFTLPDRRSQPGALRQTSLPDRTSDCLRPPGLRAVGSRPVRSISTHTADAAALLEYLRTPPAVVVGTSAGAAIAIDLAVRRPDLVRAVVAHEFPWRFARHLPTVSQVGALAKIGWLALRGRQSDATETLLRSAYTYRDGGSAWDDFPEDWRDAARKRSGSLGGLPQLDRQPSIS